MPHALAMYAWGGTLAIASGVAHASYALAQIRPQPRELLGPRGLERAAVLRRNAAFRALDPLLRWLATSIAGLPIARLRRAIDRQLVQAGDVLGLSGDEWLALSGLGVLAAACIAALACCALDLGSRWAVLGAALSAGVQWQQLRGRGAARMYRISLELPAAIDLIALCMGAGLDFSGALAAVAREAGSARSPLVRELRGVLRALDLGSTRQRALAAFAERVPIEPVQDFAAAVIQAERMGNPLREAIEIQAQALRMRRGVLAEEAAARAAVLLVFPLILLLAAIMLLMLGPFVVSGVSF